MAVFFIAYILYIYTYIYDVIHIIRSFAIRKMIIFSPILNINGEKFVRLDRYWAETPSLKYINITKMNVRVACYCFWDLFCVVLYIEICMLFLLCMHITAIVKMNLDLSYLFSLASSWYCPMHRVNEFKTKEKLIIS